MTDGLAQHADRALHQCMADLSLTLRAVQALSRINPSVVADVARHETWMKKHGAV